MKVQDFMIPKARLVYVETSASLEDASHLMVDKKVSAVVVVNHDGSELVAVGMITKTDVIRAIVKEKKSLSTPVTEIMSKSIVQITSDDQRDEAAEVIMKKKVHHLLVVDSHNHLQGVVSAWDIAREVTLDGKAWPYNREMLKQFN
eukprot:c25797_g1_i1.p1 GENE.c25797_g1_i1~~c25797_g1_i1.p1  ORF type:complete len:146 (-),score=25.21 c25797_g1_i1:41-478(-)